MINKIEKIESLGIFDDYTSDTNLDEFAKYNLIYGWNGSGKSTLSKLFYSLSTKKKCTSFPGSTFSLKFKESSFSSIDLRSFSSNVHVFNEEFVRENIDWDNLVKSLLYVSKGKVNEKTKLLKANEKLLNVNREINDLERANEGLERKNQTFLTDTAREIKKQFEVLRTDDTKYINYNKAKLGTLIRNNVKLKHKRNIVNKNEVENLKVMSRLEFLDEIELKLPDSFPYDEFVKLNELVELVLKEDVVSKSIMGLKKNPSLSMWVETGLTIHEDLKRCKFCTNEISDIRRNKLNSHFNDNYKIIKEKLKIHLVDITKFKIGSDDIPAEIDVYSFLKEALLRELNLLRKTIDDINLYLNQNIEKINKKNSNPFDLSIKSKKISKRMVDRFNKSLNQIADIIVLHNETSIDFDSKVSEAKVKLELYYAQNSIKTFDYFNKVAIIEKNKKKVALLEEEIPGLESLISRLEASLKDEVLGAAEFNTKLHRFLNHSDISLEYDKKEGGYNIRRKIGAKVSDAKFLSEGEKTAISFVYFLAKLEEDVELLKKSIVVIDDPISSFDSNHLFNAYSFIRNVCNDKIDQLFILTHNFAFFKLIRDWINGKNKKGKTIKSSFYFLQPKYTNRVRTANIINADKTLMQYNSEYHFLFKKIVDYKNQKTLLLEDCFTIANVCRKFLEIFLSFKFPKKRNDFYALLNAAITDSRYETMKDRVYKFINRYSHGDRIETFDDTVDNMISESNSIVSDFLKLIKRVDSRHYEELFEISNS